MAISSLLQSKTLSFDDNLHFIDVLSRDAVSAGNKFVETCLRFSLQVIQERMGTAVLNDYLQQGFEITIVGDNDFYSQRAQVKRRESSNDFVVNPTCHTFIHSYPSVNYQIRPKHLPPWNLSATHTARWDPFTRQD